MLGKKEGGQVNQSSLLLKAVVTNQYTGKEKENHHSDEDKLDCFS